MEFLTMDTDNRLTMFTHMIDKACGLGLWCFGMTRKLYSCTCAAAKEFRLFLDLGHCMDYAIEHAPESATPILLSDSIGMLWVAECVYQNGEPSFIIFMGPVFDAASSLKTLEDHLHGMNLSVSITIATMDKLNLVPLLPLPTLHQYIKMLHWVITEEQLDIANIRLQLREEPAPTKDTQDYLWDPNRARLLEKMIMQQIRDGTVCNFGADSGMARFAEKDAYNLGNPLRENKDAAIIFTALCSRAAMDGGLSPKISKQLEIQYVRAVEHCADMTSLMHINSNMVTDFTQCRHPAGTPLQVHPCHVSAGAGVLCVCTAPPAGGISAFGFSQSRGLHRILSDQEVPPGNGTETDRLHQPRPYAICLCPADRHQKDATANQ